MITGTLAVLIYMIGVPLALALSVFLSANKAQKMDMLKSFF